MILQGNTITPGMVLTEDTGDNWIAIHHATHGIAFVSYRHQAWSTNLNGHNIICIRTCPKGSSLVDGDILWRKATFSVETKYGTKEMSQEELTEYIKRCDDWFKVIVK